MSLGIEHALNLVGDQLLRHQNLPVVFDGQNSSIKHPMASSRQGKPIARRVRTMLVDRPNVSGFNLAFSAAIDKFQSGHGASRVVCLSYNLLKRGVADGPIDERLDHSSSV